MQQSRVYKCILRRDRPQIDAPTNAKWEQNTGNLLFNASVNGRGSYNINIYKDGISEPVQFYNVNYRASETFKERSMVLDPDALIKMDTGSCRYLMI